MPIGAPERRHHEEEGGGGGAHYQQVAGLLQSGAVDLDEEGGASSGTVTWNKTAKVKQLSMNFEFFKAAEKKTYGTALD